MTCWREDGGVGRIGYLHTARRWRNMGVARHLLRLAGEYFEDAGVEVVVADARARIPLLLRTLESAGFCQDEPSHALPRRGRGLNAHPSPFLPINWCRKGELFMRNALFYGSGVALVTPFSGGRIDLGALEALIHWQIDMLTDAIIVLGTTGEPCTIAPMERAALIERAVSCVAGRVPLIVGAGANDTRTAIACAEQAQALGADGLLVVTPYYNKASREGLLAHYWAIADSVDIPIIAYNVPSRTGMNMPPEAVAELLKHPMIRGVKEASGDIKQMQRLAALCPGAAIYAGNDDQAYAMMALGARGVISVAANVLPTAMHEMAASYLRGGRGIEPGDAVCAAGHRRRPLLRGQPHPGEGGACHDGQDRGRTSSAADAAGRRKARRPAQGAGGVGTGGGIGARGHQPRFGLCGREPPLRMRARAGVGAQEAVRTAFRLPFPTSIFEKNAVCPLKVVRRLMGDVVQIGGQRVILAVGSRKRSIVSDGDADIGAPAKSAGSKNAP